MTPVRSASTRIERFPFHQSRATRPDSPGARPAASCSSDRCFASLEAASAPRRSVNQANMSPTAAWPASYPNMPGITPSSTTPQKPGTTRSTSERARWQVLVPMTATKRPGLTTVAAGTDTWASTLATATGVPGARPVNVGSLAADDAGALAGARDLAGHLLVDDVGEARGQGGKELAVGESVFLRPERLVAGGAGVAGLDPGELPDDPVSGLDQPVGGARRRRGPRRGSGATWRRTTPTKCGRP